jgi:hypothetical protein
MVSEEFISSQYESAKEKFPKLLQPERVGEHWVINGAIDVIDDEGSPWDTFDIRIFVPQNFPEQLPMLQETGNRIPKESKWHNSLACCLSTNATIYFKLGDDITLLNWLIKFAHPFLANYVYKREKGEYASGEFAHETPGIIQGYENLFGLSGVNAVFEKLKMLCSVLHLGRNDKCFCGSGKKFKKCYQNSPFSHKYSNIPFFQLEKDLQEIRTLIKK